MNSGLKAPLIALLFMGMLGLGLWSWYEPQGSDRDNYVTIASLADPDVLSEVHEPMVFRVPVTITAYNPDRRQTDATPRITSSGSSPEDGVVALSRDLERFFGLEFGDRITIEGMGFFRFEDRMHSRKRRQVDIFMESLEKAKEFGRRKGWIRVLYDPSAKDDD